MIRKVIFLLVLGSFFTCHTASMWAQSTVEVLQSQISDSEASPAKWYQMALGFALGISGLATFIGFYFKKSVEANVNSHISKIEKRLSTLESEAEVRIQQMEQKVIDGINAKETVVNFVLDKTSEEKALLRSKRIYLEGETNSTNIQKVLRVAGFNLKNLLDKEDAIQNGYDVLFINNEVGMFSPKLEGEEGPRPKRDFTPILDLIKKQPHDVCIFYYNTNRAQLPTDNLGFDLKHRINFATNPSQIYGNLLNTLKYQERLQKG